MSKANKQMPHLIGLDIGFGQLKYISDASPVANVIPSGILAGARVPNSHMFNFDSVDLDNLVVTTTEGTYFVGKHALDVPSSGSRRTQVRDRASDPASRVLFQTGIGLSLPHETGDYKVFVVTGLPNEDFDLSIRENLIAFMEHPFEITFHLSSERSITKSITIVGMDVLRQPEGAVTYSQMKFDQNNFIVTTDSAREMVGLIDAGHFTTDYALFRQANIIENTNMSGSSVAVTEVYNRLKTKLISYFDDFGYRFKVDDKKLDVIIRTGVISYAGKEHDLSHLVEEAAREVAAVIAKDVLDAWGDEVNSLESIILTGGGAYVFAEYLREEFESRRTQGFTIIDNPEFSNVIGFYMYGAISLSDEYEDQQILDRYVKDIFFKDEN